jgi:hypothetical protein
VKGIERWARHLAVAMVRGCLVMAAVGLVASLGLVYGATRALPSGSGEWTLVAALVVTAGCLGAAVALVWRLSHLGELAHLARSAGAPERERADVRDA